MSDARLGDAGVIVDFGQIRARDLPLVGGKCANLGQLLAAGLPG